MKAAELIDELSNRGVIVTCEGENLRIKAANQPPQELLDELKRNKSAVREYLRLGNAPVECPKLPEGVFLVKYEPKNPPVEITPAIVTDVGKFIRHELAELDARLHNPIQIRAGDSVAMILSNLADVGVEVEVKLPAGGER